ncbi:MAG: helix-turn-helix transcriptional regulator, partial [Dehalococcoidia bacterium]
MSDSREEREATEARQAEFAALFRKFLTDPEFHFDGLTTQIGGVVSERMAVLDVSRAELARRLGTSPAWVTQLLRGDENLTLRTLGKLAVALEFEWAVTTRDDLPARTRPERSPIAHGIAEGESEPYAA